MHRLSLSAKTAARRLVSRPIAPKTPALAYPRASRVSSFVFTDPTRRYLTMDAKELSNYLADSPPSVVRLEIAKHFDALTDKQKRYAHYISK